MLMEYRFSLTLPQGAAFTTEGDARVDREIAGFAMRRDAQLGGNRLADVESVWTKGVELPASALRSEEHTSELPSLMRNSYADFCLKKKTQTQHKYIKEPT